MPTIIATLLSYNVNELGKVLQARSKLIERNFNIYEFNKRNPILVNQLMHLFYR